MSSVAWLFASFLQACMHFGCLVGREDCLRTTFAHLKYFWLRHHKNIQINYHRCEEWFGDWDLAILDLAPLSLPHSSQNSCHSSLPPIRCNFLASCLKTRPNNPLRPLPIRPTHLPITQAITCDNLSHPPLGNHPQPLPTAHALWLVDFLGKYLIIAYIHVFAVFNSISIMHTIL